MTDNTVPASDARPATRVFRSRRWLAVPVVACLSLAAWLIGVGLPAQAEQTAMEPPPCTTPQPPPGPTILPGTPPTGTPTPTPVPQPGPEPPAPGPTTIGVIEQAYYCLFAHYYGGSTMDNRSLLTAAFGGLVQAINRGGRDVAEATMPPLTGDRHADWAAFAVAYERVMAKLPADEALRQSLAEATMNAMVASLRDNHARWMRPQPPPPGYQPGDMYGLGLEANANPIQVTTSPETVLGPLYVYTVLGGAAKAAGVRPGDVIESVNGSAPFPAGIASTGSILSLYPRYPAAAPVRLQLMRPATGRKWTVTLRPGLFQPDEAVRQLVTSKLLRGDIAYVKLAGFAPDAAERVLQAIAELGAGRTLKGVILDLRNNHGGSPNAVNRLLGAFAHGKVTAYHCDADGACDVDRTDDTVALLNLPLAVLTDNGCASACDHFTSAVKAHQIAPLIGTRTAGAISGLAGPNLLSDNSALVLPPKRHRGPNKEIVDRIGVAPDYYVPLTAKDISTGRDPAVSKALSLLGH